ncbi:hypothetical protein PRK78_005107 [Emydomyces testavorans]|uniref:Uncharacterized protein n=1 Tax=Emydomyces testavorans TaxID=2070801 RepID=A0AAF0DJP0_9EURO|nr:hypothetical protein PRK78_005107 [Emydomyces testavorans]
MSLLKERTTSQSSTSRPAAGTLKAPTMSNEAAAQSTTTSAGYQHGQHQIYSHAQEVPEQQQDLQGEPSPAAHDAAPTFRPFFTLIEDANSSKFYHPTVHYIFADDDTDLITEAAIRSLDQQQPPVQTPSSKRNPSRKSHKKATPQEPDLSSSASDHLYTGKLPPPIPNTQEHFIILDIEPTTTTTATATSSSTSPGPAPAPPPASPAANPPAALPLPPTTHPLPAHYKITSAHSLSPTWQILNTHLTPAPTFDSSLNPAAVTKTTTTTTSDPPNPFPIGGCMLRIEGTAGSPHTNRVRGNTAVAAGQQSLEEMMELFEKRMGELRKVVDASEYGLQAQEEGDRDEAAELR